MSLLILLLILILLIILFFVFNSIIWLKSKNITNINDIIIKYIIYLNFILIITFIAYLLIYKL